MFYDDDNEISKDPFDNAPFDEEDFFEPEPWEKEKREDDPESHWDE